MIALAGGGVVFVVAVSAALLALGRRLVEPMIGLADAARAVVQGKALPPIPVSTVRELGELKDAVLALSQKQILLREVNHRIKNSLQFVAATLALGGRSAIDKETREHFDDA
jgi:two-component sensor histidine kinase